MPGVTRCICRDVPFSRLLEAAHAAPSRDGAHHAEPPMPLSPLRVSELTGAGTGCGRCVPYIAAALITGRGVLPVLPAPLLSRLAGAAARDARPCARLAGDVRRFCDRVMP